ncbi:fibronectin type III domain-containing protein [Modestobacter sp. URMC 112]
MSAVQSSSVRPTPVPARVTAALIAIVLGLLTLHTAGAPAAAAADAVPVTYAGPAYPVAGGPPSADKPQSKLWHNDGAWWGLLRSTSGPITVHRLRDHVWQDTGTVVDDRAASTGDALWEGGKLYVSSRVSGSAGTLRVVRMSYESTTDVYSLDAGFPITIGKGGSESITIARDGLSRLWVTYTQGSRVYVAHTTTGDTTWTAPFVIPVPDTTLSSDDISAVIAFGGKVGVMYSDQQSQVMRFAVHVDTAPDTSWTMEDAYTGGLAADDHINLKSLLEDDQGRIYAATKTSNDGSGEPSIVVHQRTSAGVWTSAVAATKAENATRPQLALDSTNRQLYVLMTSPESNGGGIVYYKRTPLGQLAFTGGKGTPFVSTPNVKVNNPSTTKQAVDGSTGLVVLATDDTNGRYYHGELYLGSAPPLTPAPDSTPPTAPQQVTAQATSPTSATVSWQPATDDVGVAGYRVLRSTGTAAATQVGTTTGTTFSDPGLTASGTYSYTVHAVDAAGNVSPVSDPATVTTPAGSTAPPPATGPATFVGAATATGTTTSTAVASPAGVQTGDVLVAAVATRGAPTISAPTGWTQVRVDANGSTMRQAVFVKVATSTDGSATFALSKAQSTVVQVLAYRGVSTTSPVVASAGATSTTATVTSPAAAGVTGGPVIAFAGIARTTPLTPDARLVERSEVTTPGTATYKVTAAAGDATAPGTTAGPYTTTANGSSGGVGQTVTLRPSA